MPGTRSSRVLNVPCAGRDRNEHLDQDLSSYQTQARPRRVKDLKKNAFRRSLATEKAEAEEARTSRDMFFMWDVLLYGFMIML
eukprot:CAMPEP_0114294624 /NCGR_PEP_ID=MMETSP0059-20121206/10233_1 /TAXON_ID=36894 /ORGANISM="Pyramimonas parkeae, Strain CCMP726" /LENGTH=82 /DNA_ID=CAMNT_0001416429 /DNA_START=122 /DNA_END=367 /DNA_ORIENTATION=+